MALLCLPGKKLSTYVFPNATENNHFPNKHEKDCLIRISFLSIMFCKIRI